MTIFVFLYCTYVLVFQGPAGPPGPAMSFYRAQRDSSVCVYLDLVESMTDLQYHIGQNNFFVHKADNGHVK
jgi:hypothetical protein